MLNQTCTRLAVWPELQSPLSLEPAAQKGRKMKISTEELDGSITKIVLDGRLDIEGAQVVDLKMNILAGSSEFLLIDMSQVTFLGSMGLRSILVPAQTVHRRGGKVVLFAPIPMVEEVFRASAVDQLIPIHHELGSALAALR
jgi:anti-anti-sigma factor